MSQKTEEIVDVVVELVRNVCREEEACGKGNSHAAGQYHHNAQKMAQVLSDQLERLMK
jgi:hypothetical protein